MRSEQCGYQPGTCASDVLAYFLVFLVILVFLEILVITSETGKIIPAR
ncbi:MAG: hypothetical protein HKN42_07340 [Granulosicoccus sp.]|nr:hypothetical protein [Granulosicoccus sp.]